LVKSKKLTKVEKIACEPKRFMGFFLPKKNHKFQITPYKS